MVPQASLLGLPTELRLLIYHHLFSNLLIHIHPEVPDDGGPPRFIWQPCLKPDERSTLLCANPPWSGLCSESERCDIGRTDLFKSPIALTWTCKQLNQETRRIIHRESAFSLPASAFDALLYERPDFLRDVRRLTFTGPYHHNDRMNWHVHHSLKDARALLPQLEEVAFQGQVARALLVVLDDNGRRHAPSEAYHTWTMFATVFKEFSPRVTILFDGMSHWVTTLDSPFRIDPHGQILRLTVRRRGDHKGEDSDAAGWGDDAVEVWEKLSQPVMTGGWRRWWEFGEAEHLGQ